MSWLAKSIANSLQFDDDADDDQQDNSSNSINNENYNSESDQQPTTPRGVKEDLTDLKQTLTRQFWGVASFLAPPPPDNHPQPTDLDGSKDDDVALIAGIRSDFVKIGGKFKSGISKLSSNKTVSEITKMASNLWQFGSESDEIASVTAVGVTEEVVGFARDIAMHPETWLDFPIPDTQDFEDFDMSDAQHEHALAVEHLAPRLAALRIELCPGYMTEGCFWKIYFVLLHPRLGKHDAELLSTPQILEARATLSPEFQNKAKENSRFDWSGVGTSNIKDAADLPNENSLFLPSHAEFESVPIMTSDIEAVPATSTAKASDYEAVPFHVADESEKEKHLAQSTLTPIVDKSMIEEEKVNQTKHQHSSSSSSCRVLDEKSDDGDDDWLKDDSLEVQGAGGASMPLGNDEDVSFSDLEEDDGDEPTSLKKVAPGSDGPTKESQDWVQLSRSSADSGTNIDAVGVRHAWSEQVSARNSETKESSDWLDVDDNEVI